ncbi:MAG: AmmeMemoRadiSam system protein B [Desulfobacteraceae bacterium]|nr:AmmeMemoRadiSam system protein B [Desulfobacteraceae bacterium]
MSIFSRLLLILLLLGSTTAMAETVRPAVWAGKFYPAAAAELRQTIHDLIDQAARTPFRPPAQGRLKALILPHAGYIYSGATAAHAHQALAGTTFAKVILMGPDHRVGFANGAVSAADVWATPLGKIPVHADALKLRANAALFRPIEASDLQEHSVEVILPFLQTDLSSFQLVPIVLGTCDPGQIATALAPLLDDRTLLVASTDLSHYLPYDQAVAKDKQTIQAVLDLNDQPLVSDDNRMCGRYPVAVLLQLARRFQWRPMLMHYANSGDTAGDRNAVVGYAAVAFYGDTMMDTQSSRLTSEQGQVLLQLARQTLKEKFKSAKTGDPGAPPAALLKDPALQSSSGIFVTLKMDHDLRGCIGTLTGRGPIVEEVREYSLHAAFDDPRFKPLTAKELERVTIEVSVLTKPQPLEYAGADDLIAKLRPNVDGVILKKGYRSATFLPQVWEQLPKPESFLTHLCLKAGLEGDAWRRERLEVETYQVQYFEEPH